MTEPPKFELRVNQPLDPVNCDLDRSGPPLKGVEQHEIGKPEGGVRTKQTPTLIELAKDYEFFTPALINVVAQFDRDPVVEYIHIKKCFDREKQPFAIDYDLPLFNGLGVGRLLNRSVDWDRRVYAVNRDDISDLRNCIAGMAAFNRVTRSYYRICFYETVIVDPLCLKRQRIVQDLPTVPLTVFAVDCTDGVYMLAETNYPELPHLHRMAPTLATKIEANDVLGPPVRPDALQHKRDAR